MLEVEELEDRKPVDEPDEDADDVDMDDEPRPSIIVNATGNARVWINIARPFPDPQP